MVQLQDIIPATAQDELIQLGFRLDRPVNKTEDMHELMDVNQELNLISVETFTASISIVYNEETKKHEIYSAGEKISLKVSDKGIIRPTLNGYSIKGSKRLALYKAMMEHQKYILDYYVPTHLGNTIEGDWAYYRFMWNNRVLQLSVMTGNKAANALKIYKPKPSEPTSKEYYKKWYNMSQKGNSQQLGTLEMEHEVYGNAEASLGGIISDQIEDELLEAYKTFTQYKDTYIGRKLLEDLATLLDNA